MPTAKIEKGVPVSKKAKTSENKYPFDKMDVGDSFFVEIKANQTQVNLQSQLLQNAKSWSNYAKQKRTWRSSQEANGVRIWRTK